MKTPLGGLAALTVFIYGIGLVIPAFEGLATRWLWPAMVGGYATMVYALYAWAKKAAGGSDVQFVTAISGATAVKMLSTLIFATVYLAADGTDRVLFVAGLFAVFAANTAWLLVQLQRATKRGVKK